MPDTRLCARAAPPFWNKFAPAAEKTAAGLLNGEIPIMIKYVALAVSALLIAADQLLKQWAMAALAPVHQIPVIPGFFYLTYVENRGAAFGMLQNKTLFLSVVSLCVLLFALWAILSGKLRNKYLLWSVALVFAGGTGNCIDRIARGFVVDYLDFSVLFGFPVFNFADCCVVVGTALILIYVIALDRGEKKRASSADAPDHGEA